MSRRVVSVDASDFEKLQKDLHFLRRKALPHAVRNGLNDEAFGARKIWQTEISQTFNEKNKYTRRSIRVEKARGTDLHRMEAVVGSTADYMDEQEEGATLRSSGSYGTPIPTATASGEGRVRGSDRKRPVRAPNKLDAINIAPRVKKGSRHVRLAGTIALANRKGYNYVFLNLGRKGQKTGIFKLTGGKRRTKLRMVWDLSEQSVRLKPRPTMAPTVANVRGWAAGLHRRAMIDQMRRHKLLGFG